MLVEAGPRAVRDFLKHLPALGLMHRKKECMTRRSNRWPRVERIAVAPARPGDTTPLATAAVRPHLAAGARYLSL